MSVMVKFVPLFLVLVSLSAPSEAYIDPGSGMAFVSGIGAWIVAFFALIFGTISMTYKRWMQALKNMFSSLKARFSSSKD